jgi:hypothetical protein
MARNTHRRSWSTAYLRFQSLHKFFNKNPHSRPAMGCENDSIASANQDDDTISDVSDDFMSKICQKCISSAITSDPSTLEGQQEGSILVIKCITSRNEDDLQPQVGDHVLLLHFDTGKLAIVKNLRGFLTSRIPWVNFFSVPYFGKCVCTKGHCRCLYKSEENSLCVILTLLSALC